MLSKSTKTAIFSRVSAKTFYCSLCRPVNRERGRIGHPSIMTHVLSGIRGPGSGVQDPGSGPPPRLSPLRRDSLRLNPEPTLAGFEDSRIQGFKDTRFTISDE